MKQKKSLLKSIMFVILFLCYSSAAMSQPINSTKNPTLSISSGSSHEHISVNANELFSISVSMDAGDMLNKAGDWWLVYVTPDNRIFSLTNERRWAEGLVPILSIPMISFGPIPVISVALTLTGSYSFYFAVDDKPDGIPQDPIWLDGL
ncbi:MAG: hypothetical protein HQK62_15400, partial [Desulfamplus sp.]|nr:hypothetical protein [Desulfamplus sp.]